MIHFKKITIIMIEDVTFMNHLIIIWLMIAYKGFEIKNISKMVARCCILFKCL